MSPFPSTSLLPSESQLPEYYQVPVPVLWASGSADEVADTTIAVIDGPGVSFRRSRVIVAQLGFPPGPTAPELASQSLLDSRPVPVLVGRR